MELHILKETPPWDWPPDAAPRLLHALRDEGTKQGDRLLAAELAGDFTVINDELAGVLLTILHDPDASEALRGQAALSLGPALEYADTEGFEEMDEAPISEPTFQRIQRTLHTLYGDQKVSDSVRRHILEASVRAPEDWHQDAVRAAYAVNDPGDGCRVVRGEIPGQRQRHRQGLTLVRHRGFRLHPAQGGRVAPGRPD